MADYFAVLRRIQKLHAMAQSAKQLGNIAEAAAFAGKVEAMLTEHKLSLSEIEMVAQEREDPIGEEDVLPDGGRHGRPKGGRQRWQQDLATVVARAHYCSILVYRGSNLIGLVGRTSDRAVASYMITSLTLLAAQQSLTELRCARNAAYASPNPLAARGYRAAWLRGFVLAITERYVAQQTEREQPQGLAPKGSTALVRLTQAHAVVDQYVQQHYKKSAAPIRGQRLRNADGFAAGLAAGHRANLSNPRGTLRRGGDA